MINVMLFVIYYTFHKITNAGKIKLFVLRRIKSIVNLIMLLFMSADS